MSDPYTHRRIKCPFCKSELWSARLWSHCYRVHKVDLSLDEILQAKAGAFEPAQTPPVKPIENEASPVKPDPKSIQPSQSPISGQAHYRTSAEQILGVKVGEQPLPPAPKIMVPNSFHGKRKQRRSAYEVPGQTAAELGLGLSAPP